jgi:hypothetical protein
MTLDEIEVQTGVIVFDAARQVWDAWASTRMEQGQKAWPAATREELERDLLTPGGFDPFLAFAEKQMLQKYNTSPRFAQSANNMQTGGRTIKAAMTAWLIKYRREKPWEVGV